MTGPQHVPTLVIAFKTLTLLLGGLVALLAAKAARRTGDRGLGLLALGFAVVTLGSLAAGVVDQALAVPASRALAVESGLTTIGFAIVAASLVATGRAG